MDRLPDSLLRVNPDSEIMHNNGLYKVGVLLILNWNISQEMYGIGGICIFLLLWEIAQLYF